MTDNTDWDTKSPSNESGKCYTRTSLPLSRIARRSCCLEFPQRRQSREVKKPHTQTPLGEDSPPQGCENESVRWIIGLQIQGIPTIQRPRGLVGPLSNSLRANPVWR